MNFYQPTVQNSISCYNKGTSHNANGRSVLLAPAPVLTSQKGFVFPMATSYCTSFLLKTKTVAWPDLRRSEGGGE